MMGVHDWDGEKFQRIIIPKEVHIHCTYCEDWNLLDRLMNWLKEKKCPRCHGRGWKRV